MSALLVAASIALLTIAEQRRPSWGVVLYWATFLAAGYAFSFVIAAVQIWPLLMWHSHSLVLGAIAWLLTYDFLYYWYHRAQHRYTWLWHFHKVHHSITDLSALNSYHHLAEHVTRFVGVVLPFEFLLRVDMPHVMFFYAVVTFWGHYLHSPVRFNFGSGRVLLADNVYHKVHHERQGNFAAFFPVFDWAFGTKSS